MDPMQNQSATPTTEGKKSFGPLAGVIIIVILLVLGAIYMFSGGKEATDDVSTIESELQAGDELNVDISELDSI